MLLNEFLFICTFVVSPSAFTVTLPGSTALDVLCVSAEAEGANHKATENSAEGTFRTGWASLIYPRMSLSLTLSPAWDHNTITQDQMGVMSSLRTNGPWLAASFIVLNGVSVVLDSATTHFDVVVVFKEWCARCTLYLCLHLAPQ